MEQTFEFITDLTPSVLAAGTTVSTFYRDRSELITFIISILKALMILISFSYVAYLYYGKNQQVKETLLWIILIEKGITLIFVLVGIYLTYNRTKEVIKSQATKLKNDIKSKILKRS
jgi:ABC-type nickel/cobalt efflux system permease component RcnA